MKPVPIKPPYDVYTMSDFDDCIVGVVERCGIGPLVCYDTNKVVEKLVREGMTLEEAREFHEFNQSGAYVGEGTPCFLYPMDREEIEAWLEEAEG